MLLKSGVTSVLQDAVYSRSSGIIETSSNPHAAHSKRRISLIADKGRWIEPKGFEANGRRIAAHRIGASHIEADEALRLEVGDRERLGAHAVAF